MPVFEYKCNACEHTYEILHLSKENTEDIICPHCNSHDYKKLISVFSSASDAQSDSARMQMPSGPSCGCGPGGGCFN
jgi:putative FmdB family regulatory protein